MTLPPSTPAVATDIPLSEARRDPEARRLHLTWADGSQAAASYDLLQGYCPCAHCRGHDGGEIVYQAPSTPVRSVELAAVGNYAVHIAFDPGCNAGIFGFDFLRRLCQREGLLRTAGEPQDG